MALVGKLLKVISVSIELSSRVFEFVKDSRVNVSEADGEALPGQFILACMRFREYISPELRWKWNNRAVVISRLTKQHFRQIEMLQIGYSGIKVSPANSCLNKFRFLFGYTTAVLSKSPF